MAEVRLTVHLDEQSKATIDDLIGRLDFCGPIEPRNERENSALQRAREQSEIDKVSLPTMLLRLLAKEESREAETSGFVGKLRSAEAKIRELQSSAKDRENAFRSIQKLAHETKRERAMFSDEVDHLKRQVDACHTKIDELKNDADKSTTQKRELSEFLKNAMDENRALKASNRTVCVRDMFVRVLSHQERNDRPTVPGEAAIRLQTRIDAEEFVEKLIALYDDPLVSSLDKILHAIAKHGTIRHDLHNRLPEFADALADNAVTNEGFAVLFGIDLEPVFQEVHASNMRKGDGPIVDGKRRKPEGWVGPDVAGVLRKQGWSPSSESKVDEPIPYKLSCEIHGMIFGGGHECSRCENAQYNGSEIDPIGELAREASVEVVAIFGSVEEDGETIRVKFRTEDRLLTERLQMIARKSRTVVPEIQGKAYPRSKIPNIRVDYPTWGDPYFDVSIEFRKVD